jgi:hypothetical protein
MVAWFIIALATLAIFAFIAVNGVQTVSATTDGIGRVETVRRLDAAASALIARSGSPNNTGRMMVLAGTTVNNVYGLPVELSSFASTPFGQRIVYCPFGDGESGTGTTNVPSGGGATYPIETKPDSSGRVFVTAGRPGFPQVANNPNLMAFLIAPRTKTSATPNCSAVRYNPTTRRFEAPDALVRAVIRGTSPDDLRQQASRDVVFYVSPSGNGRGQSQNDPASLYSAITYYRATAPQSMRVIMATGAYILPQQYLNATAGGFSDKGDSTNLVIEGQNSTLDFEGPANGTDIWLPGTTEFRNLTIASGAGVWAEQGHRMILRNTTTGFLRINNGGYLYANNATVTDVRQGYAVMVNNGAQATLNGNISLYVAGANYSHALAGAGSRLLFEGATLTLGAVNGGTGYLGLHSEGNGDMMVKSSVINVNTTIAFPVLVQGKTTMSGSRLVSSTYNGRMFEIQRGGFLTLDGSYGEGIAPGNGIIDVGASGVAGVATIRNAGACWTNASNPNGVQFNRSQNAVQNGADFTTSINGSVSTVTADETMPGMSPNPTAAEIANYSAAQARNVQRAQLRNTNTSVFTCQRG